MKEPIIKIFWKCTQDCQHCKKKNGVKICTCPGRTSQGPCYICGGI